LAVYLKEDYNNKWIEPEVDEEIPEEIPEIPEAPITGTYIEGPAQVYPYDFATYTIHNSTNGIWKLSNKRAKILA